jgi:hypothetical protein
MTPTDLQIYGGRYSSACADATAPHAIVTNDTLVVE